MFENRQELGIFLFTTASRPALGPSQPPIQWVLRSHSLGVKRPVRKTDHSPPSSAEVKNAWSYTSAPQYVFITWSSVKAQGKLHVFTFYKLILPTRTKYNNVQFGLTVPNTYILTYLLTYSMVLYII
jgi:hypothetical protein